MAATDFPTATTSVDAQASAGGAGDGYVAIFTPVGTLDDYTPRLYASGAAAMAAHGYSPGIAYGALHAQRTRRPFIIVPMEIDSGGVLSAVNDHSATGTSTVTVTGTALEAVDATLTVVTGGTRGTAGIVLSLTLDGGATTKTIRLGTAVSYVVPNLGITISFAAGTLVAGEYYTFTSSALAWGSTEITAARAALAASQYAVRTWVVIGEMTPTLAGHIVTHAEAYASANERFVMARACTTDLSESTWALEAAAQGVSFADVNSTDGRLSLGFGRRRILCPITGCMFRRGADWAASLQEYRRDLDVHNTSWWRALGALSGWTTIAGDVEHDERVDGGALAGRFTCFTSLANATGVYIAKDLTRADDDSTLLLPNNAQVTNIVCTVVQAETTRILGMSVVLNSDGTIDANQAVDVEEAVNGALERELLAEHVAGRGPRVSYVRWTASRDDDLRGAGATMTGVCSVNLRGVVSQISTQVKVS